jgi:hypothetical protein
MKITKIDGRKELIEFSSLNDFYNYITNTEFNKTFDNDFLRSSKNTSQYYANFSKTKNFKQAIDLFKNGWQDMSEKLNKKLDVSKVEANEVSKYVSKLDVCGYQAIVPLYLQGVPTSMLNRKVVTVKQKVITINKDISYPAIVSSDKIIDESVKALQIIKKIESQGIRCNLNILIGTKENDKEIYVKIRIKNANERLNVSKLAFPLVHPSMLRRLYVRFIEVYPSVPKSFRFGYGSACVRYDWQNVLKGSGEYYIPSILNGDVKNINIESMKFV